MLAKVQLNSIRVFEAVARQMSFKAAAKELNVTSTAVSHRIAGLEETLGILLFERKPRSIALTPEGAKLAPVAYQSLQQLAEVLEEISAARSTLTISTTTAFAAMWLAPRLDDFYALHPDIQIVMKTGENLDDLQKNRQIDLAIRYGPFNTQDRRSTSLVTERFAMYATKKYLDSISRVQDAILIETNWKNKSLPPVSWKECLALGDEEAEYLKIRSFDQEHHAIQAALAGKGIALVSSLLVQTAVDNGWLEEFKSEIVHDGFTYYLMIPPHKEQNRNVEIFRKWLINETKTEKS